MFKIREAKAEDTPALLALIKELAEFEKLAHEVRATEATLRENLFSGRKVSEALLAEKDGQAIGFALYFHNVSTFLGRPGLYLEDLYVQPNLRGSGVGLALLAKLAQIAEARGCGRMEWSVLNWNEKAIEFYKKLGAQPMDEWSVYRLTEDRIKTLARRLD
jgi:GNAT superfamily N-acetyltransferase